MQLKRKSEVHHGLKKAAAMSASIISKARALPAPEPRRWLQRSSGAGGAKPPLVIILSTAATSSANQLDKSMG